MEHNQTIILFQEKGIRRVWHNEEWFFAVNDVISVLTNSLNPADYFRKMLIRDIELKKGVGQFVLPLPVPTTRGKQNLKCANRQTLLRIIMSIPSPNAEPFKLWLAQVGEERMQEIENPELAIARIKAIYQAKGYSETWIEARMKSMNLRKQLTDEWKIRGIQEAQEYSILTAEIAKATFGLTPSQHKDLKGLERQNLRDHMTQLELIFSMLGEEATRQIAVNDDSQGFRENFDVAQRGGAMAGDALKGFEKSKNLKVVSSENFIEQISKAKKIERIIRKKGKKE